MQKQKSNIRQLILKTAHEEFLEHGFKDSSMRRIAKGAGVGLSNIYNYFKNKDEIFCEVLAPVLRAFDKLQEEHNHEDYITREVFTMKKYQESMIADFMELISNHRAELRLLLFQASGSSLEDFRDTFTDKQTSMGLEYMELMKEKYPCVNNDISTFFIHTIGSWWLTILGEIISHDELTEVEIEKFLSEYIAFCTSGWKTLMNM